MMRGVSEAVTVLMMTLAFLGVSTFLLAYFANKVATQQGLITNVLEEKQKQLNEKLAVVYTNKQGNNWTIIVYNYGGTPVYIRSLYDGNGKSFPFNITANPVMPNTDSTITFTRNTSSVLIFTDYNVYRING